MESIGNPFQNKNFELSKSQSSALDPAPFAGQMIQNIQRMQEVVETQQSRKQQDEKERHQKNKYQKTPEEEELEILMSEIDKRLENLESMVKNLIPSNAIKS